MSLFDWLKKKPTIESSNIIKQQARMPISKDWTDQYTVNSDLTRGLYHNTYPGMKLAGGLAYPPIAIPVNFMGLPVPKPVDDNDEITKAELAELTDMFCDLIVMINTFHSVDGTIWVWPFWSSKANRLIWEIIDDDSICTIVRDIETKDIVKIITDEELSVTVDYNKNVNVKRRRTFTQSEITVEWFGTGKQLPEELKSVRMRNVFNVIPIPFSNNVDPGDVRGHSDYERIITDLKDYHDIDLARSVLLAKFQPKLVQGCQNGEDWITNLLKMNGWNNPNEIDIAKLDLIINLFEKESTTILWPERAHEAYTETLKQKFQKLVETSGSPEIVWGLKTQGNNASAETSLDGLMKHVHGKQDQTKKPYNTLYSKSLQITRFVRMSGSAPAIKITWNDLDAVSDETRSKIFANIADGVSKLNAVAGWTKDMLHKFMLGMYPEITDENYEEFEKGLSAMAEHKQFTDASYTEALDYTGGNSDTEDDIPDPDNPNNVEIPE